MQAGLDDEPDEGEMLTPEGSGWATCGLAPMTATRAVPPGPAHAEVSRTTASAVTSRADAMVVPSPTGTPRAGG